MLTLGNLFCRGNPASRKKHLPHSIHGELKLLKLTLQKQIL